MLRTLTLSNQGTERINGYVGNHPWRYGLSSFIHKKLITISNKYKNVPPTIVLQFRHQTHTKERPITDPSFTRIHDKWIPDKWKRAPFGNAIRRKNKSLPFKRPGKIRSVLSTWRVWDKKGGAGRDSRTRPEYFWSAFEALTMEQHLLPRGGRVEGNPLRMAIRWFCMLEFAVECITDGWYCRFMKAIRAIIRGMSVHSATAEDS